MDNGEEVRITSTTGAQKGSKLARYDLIPAVPLNELAKVYGKGASKYADRNWEGGYDWSLSFAALNRHLWAFWNGEDTDPELGTPHMANVAWHAFVLLEFMNTHPELDNRPNTVHEEEQEEPEVYTMTWSDFCKADYDIHSQEYAGDHNWVIISPELSPEWFGGEFVPVPAEPTNKQLLDLMDQGDFFDQPENQYFKA